MSDAGVDGVGHGAEGGGEVGVANGVVDGFGLFFAREHACAGEEGEVATDDGKIDGAAGGDFGDGAGPGALGETGEERETRGIAQGFEEIG